MNILTHFKYPERKLGFLFMQPKGGPPMHCWIKRVLGIQGKRWMFGLFVFGDWEETP